MKREDDLSVPAAMTRLLQICFSAGGFRLQGGGSVGWSSLLSLQT